MRKQGVLIDCKCFEAQRVEMRNTVTKSGDSWCVESIFNRHRALADFVQECSLDTF